MLHLRIRLISWYITSLLLLSAILTAKTYAQKDHRSWIHPQDPKIGLWQNGQLKMNLKAIGQVTLAQSMVHLKAKSDQDVASAVTTLYGYWWSDSDQLCLNFDLHSRCTPYTLKSTGQVYTLSIRVGREWVELTKVDQKL